jgi:hypothetical protein
MELFHLGISHGVPLAYPDVFHFFRPTKTPLAFYQSGVREKVLCPTYC